MNVVVDFVLNEFLAKPVILLGLLIGIGYILKREKGTKVITGTISAMVGIQMILFGGGQFAGMFQPIVAAVNEVTGVSGYLMDSYAMRVTSQEALGERFALMGYTFLLAFAINLLFVFFGKYTGAKGIFLTGNAGTAHAQGMLWLVLANLLVTNVVAVIIAGVILGIYWSYSTTLAIKTCEEVTDGAGFTIGHNQQIGIWFFGKLAPFFGKKEQDAENLKLPGWLSIFNNNVVAVCIIMWIFIGAFMIPLGPSGIQELAGNDHWIMYLIILGIRFSMMMVILLTGVRMMCAELAESFKGIQEKVVPHAVPAIDVAALLPFSPNAATLGFIFCAIGTALSIGILILVRSPIMVLPGFIPLFFSGGPIGVVANKKGGIKAIMVCGILLGMIQSFGTVWAIHLMRYPEGMGWSGMFDLSTLWPAITQVMSWIGALFH